MEMMATGWTGGDPSLRWPWLVVGLTVLTLVLLVVWLKPWRKQPPKDAAYVAHTERLRSLPRYRSLVRKRVTFAILISVSTLMALAGSIILGGRVQETQTKQRDEANRDIMLCLDSSGSMAGYNAEILEEMQDIVAGLKGERIGLSIWSRSTVTIFPLTDDYEFATEQLKIAEEAFDGVEGYSADPEDIDEYIDFVTGTQRLDGNAEILSQIGDGLASCVQRFGDLDEGRGRAIVLASDNEPIGKGIYTFDEASDYAIESEIVVHGIGAEGGYSSGDELEEMEDQITKTGGLFAETGDDGSADQIVSEINELEAAKQKKPPLVQTIDLPFLGTLITGIGLGLLLLTWLCQGFAALIGRRSS